MTVCAVLCAGHVCVKQNEECGCVVPCATYCLAQMLEEAEMVCSVLCCAMQCCLVLCFALSCTVYWGSNAIPISKDQQASKRLPRCLES